MTLKRVENPKPYKNRVAMWDDGTPAGMYVSVYADGMVGVFEGSERVYVAHEEIDGLIEALTFAKGLQCPK